MILLGFASYTFDGEDTAKPSLQFVAAKLLNGFRKAFCNPTLPVSIRLLLVSP